VTLSVEKEKPMTTKNKTQARREMYQRAVLESFIKLNPRWMVRNPVMFVVEVGSVLTTLLWIQALLGQGEAPTGFIGAIAFGCGSPCCSPTSPKPLPRGVGKRKPSRCAKARQDTPAKKVSSNVENV
jgi:potassium-transporting ATPase ATP-binding subunit